jgi:hypothetical protein
MSECKDGLCSLPKRKKQLAVTDNGYVEEENVLENNDSINE